MNSVEQIIFAAMCAIVIIASIFALFLTGGNED